MFSGNDDVTSIIVGVLLLIGTWLTARATKTNTKVQATAQLKQVDQSAYNVAEGIFKSAIAQLSEENKALKAENKGLKDDIDDLRKRQRDQEYEINLLKGLIRNVD